MASIVCPAHPLPWNSAYRRSKTCYRRFGLGWLGATEKLTLIALVVLSSDAQTLAMILRLSVNNVHSIAKLAAVFNARFLLEHGMWRSGLVKAGKLMLRVPGRASLAYSDFHACNGCMQWNVMLIVSAA
eukprot:1137509-Pelagomonas_calceolata.AAC.1